MTFKVRIAADLFVRSDRNESLKSVQTEKNVRFH